MALILLDDSNTLGLLGLVVLVLFGCALGYWSAQSQLLVVMRALGGSMGSLFDVSGMMSDPGPDY